MSERRVVITGIGTLNPLGNNVPEFFRNLDEGKSGACMIDRFDVSQFKTRFACQIPSYDPKNFSALSIKEARSTDLFSQFAIIAADEAVKDSKMDLDKVDLDRVGAIIGSSVGGISTMEHEFKDYVEGEQPRFSPYMIPKFITNIASGLIAIKYGFRGPNYCITSACATSAHALTQACMEIKSGRVDVMVTGGAEAPISKLAVGGFSAAKAISTRNDEYLTASRPFDRTRDGFVIGEGAAVLILEEYSHAVSRGARIYAELAGSGMSCDAYHITAPHPEGRGAAAAMEYALRDASLRPEDVDYINVHGTSTVLGDVIEIKAIKSVFGEKAYDLNISSTKSMTGHLLGAAGAVEALACIHALESGIIPPTINFTEEDENIDYKLNLTLNRSQQRKVDVAMSNNFGFGGQNSCLIFKKIN